MNRDKYNMSFSTGALFKRESLLVASIFTNVKDWNLVKKYVFEHNTFQARTVSTLQKIYGEISSRLQHLTDEEISLLNILNDNEQGYILWIAICRKYRFISEFAREVVRERFLSHQNIISCDCYNIFFNAKADWEHNLDSLSLNTQKKLRQILFRMLREANLLSSDNRIIPVVCSQRMEGVFKEANNFLFFPVQIADGWSR